MNENGTFRFVSVGLGKMGTAVKQNAIDRGHISVADFGRINPVTKEKIQALGQVDLVFECTLPSVAVDNIVEIVSAQKDCVVATTAWYDRLEEVKEAVRKHNTRLMYANNYSIGVALYEKIVAYSAQLFNAVTEYDVWGHEIHHRNKVESPSGTAKNLEKILLKYIERKTVVVEDALLHRKPRPEELHFSSTRGGYNNFSHTVSFDSPDQVISLQHTSKTRDAFSVDMVKAGEWLLHQKPGLYTMEDFLHDIIQ